ncbi:MAG: fibronectin type III domain-containing protein [Anaerolineae bacterium]|nr:fibronectin type III domain-containing protein [Anaerolineae bacterium]
MAESQTGASLGDGIFHKPQVKPLSQSVKRNRIYPSFDTVSVSLSFTPDSSGEVNQWQLERQTGGIWQLISTLPVTTNQYTDFNLSCSTSYSYRLRAYRAEDTAVSPYSSETPITTLDCVAAVENTVGLYRNGLWLFTNSLNTAQPQWLICFTKHNR